MKEDVDSLLCRDIFKVTEFVGFSIYYISLICLIIKMDYGCFHVTPIKGGCHDLVYHVSTRMVKVVIVPIEYCPPQLPLDEDLILIHENMEIFNLRSLVISLIVLQSFS